ncbi:Integral membrane protein [Scedosporium apiospermum]|uniref:Integral membrane protein n=1 Tax=Pseudallescheria apiosperma TaxID=563466 RepID=A0A084GDC0_PSEDA|nr:Integral membrane protein [Scedosporium apiospermum]KEZ45332.1 Integral membrane protein [Scedosporium apiospermum]
MGIGAFAEPLVVITLLFGGAWFNRTLGRDNVVSNLVSYSPLGHARKRSDDYGRRNSDSELSDRDASVDWASNSGTLSPLEQSRWRNRKIRLFRYQRTVSTPNTTVFKDRLLSRLLQKFPFLVEAWYWALIYWVYQLGRAFTALTLVEGTVDVARKHALQLVHIEQALGIFIERPIQDWFLHHPNLMRWTNRTYSFIHIPGTILFLVLLYYFTTTRKRRALVKSNGSDNSIGGSSGPMLYEARRRTMALCNLIAFIVFTLWPCMPPRLLSDPEYEGPDAVEAKSFGFVDTVHSADGEKSVWTTNKFCNQYAAMPSLHFGYSLLIGLTIATFPIAGLRSTSWKRLAIVCLGMSYPAIILAAIVATANHFVLDAVAGAIVCGIAWNANGVLLNLLVLEDYFLWAVRIHKPVNWTDPETAVERTWQGTMVQDV